MTTIVGKLLPTVGYTTGRGTDGWDTDMEPTLRKLDALVQGNAISIINTLPAPVEGATYIVGTAPTGIAAGWANRVVRANAQAGTWDSFVPAVGWRMAVSGNDYRWNGSAWVVSGEGGFVPMISAATASCSHFGGSGQATAKANWLKNNIGLAMSDARSLSWCGGMFSSDTTWGLAQDAAVSTSFKPFVLQDGAGNIWYKNDPLASDYKHTFTGAIKFANSVEMFSTTTLRGDVLVNQDTLFAANSVDGNDQSALSLCGGGSSNSNRGAFIQVRGNERASSGGTVTIAAGDSSAIQGEIQLSTSGALRMVVTKAGEVNVSSGAFRVGSFGGLIAATSGLLRQAISSDFPGPLNAFSQLANGNGFLRNSGAGVQTWEAAIPAASFSTLSVTNFGGTGVSAYAYQILSNNGIGFQDSRGLSWRGGLFNTDNYWGLGQDASLATSFKPMVFKDGSGSVWYKLDPQAATYKHSFSGEVQCANPLTSLQGLISNRAVKVGSHAWSGGGGPNSNRVCSGVPGGSLGLFSGSHYEDSGTYSYLELRADGFTLAGSASSASSLYTDGGYLIGRKLIPRGLYLQPNKVTQSRTTPNEVVFVRCDIPGLTETLPLATGTGRVIEFRYSGTSGSWTIQSQGTDTINNNGTNAATVTSVTLYASTGVPNLRLLDADFGKWEKITN